MVKRKTPELDELLRSVRARTKKRGSIKLLADDLGVLPQTLTDWLSGRFEPGGEITLRLHNWAYGTKANQQKKRGGSVRAQPPLKTRIRKSKANEKPKSNPPPK